MPETIILKLQRPIYSSVPGNNTVLVYNEDRSMEFMTGMDDELRGLFGDRFKIFVGALIDADSEGPNNMTIRGEVADPGW